MSPFFDRRLKRQKTLYLEFDEVSREKVETLTCSGTSCLFDEGKDVVIFLLFSFDRTSISLSKIDHQIFDALGVEKLRIGFLKVHENSLSIIIFSIICGFYK
jgi:hypothetical protein